MNKIEYLWNNGICFDIKSAKINDFELSVSYVFSELESCSVPKPSSIIKGSEIEGVVELRLDVREYDSVGSEEEPDFRVLSDELYLDENIVDNSQLRKDVFSFLSKKCNSFSNLDLNIANIAIDKILEIVEIKVADKLEEIQYPKIKADFEVIEVSLSNISNDYCESECEVKAKIDGKVISDVLIVSRFEEYEVVFMHGDDNKFEEAIREQINSIYGKKAFRKHYGEREYDRLYEDFCYNVVCKLEEQE